MLSHCPQTQKIINFPPPKLSIFDNSNQKKEKNKNIFSNVFRQTEKVLNTSTQSFHKKNTFIQNVFSWWAGMDSHLSHAEWDKFDDGLTETGPTSIFDGSSTQSFHKKNTFIQNVFSWWAGMDSNHRRHSRRIYSPLHLAALQPTQTKRFFLNPSKMELAKGIEPSTC